MSKADFSSVSSGGSAMFCMKCGARVGDNAKFCRHCGAPVRMDTANNNGQMVQQVETISTKTPQQPQPVKPQTVNPVGGRAESQAAQKPPKKKGKGLLIGLIIFLFLASIGLGVIAYFIFFQGNDILDNIIPNTSKEEVIEEDNSERESEEAGNSKYAKYIEDKDFVGLFAEMMKEEDVAVYEADLKNAVAGYQEDIISKLDELISAGNYEEAIESLNTTISELEKYRSDSKIGAYFSENMFSDKMEEIKRNYQSYAIEQATSMANQGNTDEVQAIFEKADKYLEGEEYETEKTKVFTKLVRSNISNMQSNGEQAKDIMQYIDVNLELVHNDCWVLEFWDYFDAVYEMETGYAKNKGSVNHANSDGYLLPDSDCIDYTMDDLQGFGIMECRLARYEIYAKHGRTFNDQAVTKYFSKFGWYSQNVSPESFDEFSLNEHEIHNRDLIVEYEKQQGYRDIN